MKSIGDRIKAIRIKFGLNQAELAEKLGITSGTYGKIERGEIEITFTRLEQLAKIYGITSIDIIQFDGLDENLNIIPSNEKILDFKGEDNFIKEVLKHKETLEYSMKILMDQISIQRNHLSYLAQIVQILYIRNGSGKAGNGIAEMYIDKETLEWINKNFSKKDISDKEIIELNIEKF